MGRSTCVGADDVNPKDAIGILVREHFNGALIVAHSAGAGVGHEWEGTFVVGNAFLFDLLLSESLQKEKSRKDRRIRGAV